MSTESSINQQIETFILFSTLHRCCPAEQKGLLHPAITCKWHDKILLDKSKTQHQLFFLINKSWVQTICIVIGNARMDGIFFNMHVQNIAIIFSFKNCFPLFLVHLGFIKQHKRECFCCLKTNAYSSLLPLHTVKNWFVFVHIIFIEKKQHVCYIHYFAEQYWCWRSFSSCLSKNILLSYQPCGNEPQTKRLVWNYETQMYWINPVSVSGRKKRIFNTEFLMMTWFYIVT